MNNRLSFQVPPGVKDFLPKEAAQKRKLETRFAEVFDQWGYEEIVTPTFEYDKSLIIDAGESVAEQLYRFFDRDGKILALRPDMTTPIARVVATRLCQMPVPQRLFYLANVFRYEDPQAGRQREFYQAGIELIGDSSPYADGEVIALTVKCLQEAG
ncbi:MAG: ATP phosphoribosyltransferase regulatory subunit, partial [Bacillota bacterium]|nr:ATP phosphoribosyltransferase regulatory subunit [Bacillota bacterium]